MFAVCYMCVSVICPIVAVMICVIVSVFCHLSNSVVTITTTKLSPATRC